jgi:thiol:disulfide interchange protein DsbA
MMQRRQFTAASAAALGAIALGQASVALAQGGLQQGKDYLRLSQTLPSSNGKIEVIEFFLYTCPHCFAFDPLISAWSKQLPADVSFRRVHVGVGAMHKLHQRLAYALESLGRLADLHEAVFKSVQVERLDLSDEKSIQALAVRLGLDGAKFSAAFNSFGAQTRLAQSDSLAQAYQVQNVPALGIGGRFQTGPGLAGTRGQSELANGRRTLEVADALIQQLRSGKA